MTPYLVSKIDSILNLKYGVKELVDNQTISCYSPNFRDPLAPMIAQADLNFAMLAMIAECLEVS